MDEDALEIRGRPLPARSLNLSGRNTPHSIPATPVSEQQSFGQNSGKLSLDGADTPTRTRSILNLTSSTLFGIYKDTGYATDREEPTTPWGTGTQTPIDGRKSSLEMLRSSIPEAFSQNKGPSAQYKRQTPTLNRPHPVRRGLRGYWLPLLSTVSALFGVGMMYGWLISHLHERDDIAPVKLEGIDRSGWSYTIFWGVAGVLLGWTLPAVDTFWAESAENVKANNDNSRGVGAWSDVIRSVGLFVGIAFAIRKLPWQSTMQLSLTLALANPAIWYLIDRSAPGFLVSTIVAFAGTAVLLLINPAVVPAPAPARLSSHIVKHMGHNVTAPGVSSDHLLFGVLSEESIGVATWLASVLFVSAVCFGNVGRRLAAQR